MPPFVFFFTEERKGDLLLSFSLLKKEKEALPESRQLFEAAAAQTCGLVNLVFSLQTGFSSASIRLVREKRREFLPLVQCYKIVFGIDHPSFPDFFEFAESTRTRANHDYKLYLRRAVCNCYKYSFFIRIVRK